MFVVAWIRHSPPLLHEVCRIAAMTRPELLAGVASALRKKRIQPGLELAIIDCPPSEDAELRDEIEMLMAQANGDT